MKTKQLIFLSALCATASLFSQEVDPDLPMAPKVKAENNAAGKTTKKNPYLIMSEVPTAFYSVYSDLNRIKWLSVPVDSTKPISQAECDKISDAYIADCLKKAKAETKKDQSAAYYKELGAALVFRSRWDDAIKAYEAATNVYSYSDQNVAECLYEIANCQLGAGRTNLCHKTLRELLSRNLKTGGWLGRRRLPNMNSRAYQVLHWLEDRGLVQLDLPRWTDCKPFPEPQIATYTEKFAPCAQISISTSGINKSDARINLLKKKLKSKGIEVVDRGGYLVKIELSPKAKVDKSEGYTLDVTSKMATITSRDKQGILWGVVSFLQVCDYQKKVARICNVEDWPNCPKRGFLGRCSIDDCEFMIFNKMNINTAKPNFLSQGNYAPFNIYKTQMMAKEYNDLGLELYFGFSPFTMDLAWPLCWNVFLEMQLEHAMRWASCGVGIYYPYDDARYWPNTYTEEDKATGRKPSDYDVEHLLKFYTRIKAKYPSFKMQFCPPFYWGPRAGHPYPDSRDKYLMSMRKLPEEVSLFWTGERVGSHKKQKPHCDWYSNLIGRKPSLFQNKAGPHYYLSYVLDEMPWDEWYYDGFVDQDMRSIQKNSDTPEDFPILSTLADYLWNVKGYDRTRAVKRGLNQYAGRDVYEILKPAYDKLCRIDAYRYGAVNSRVLGESLADWEQGYVLITNATEQVRKIAGGRVMRGFGSWERAIGFYRSILRGIRNPPDYKKKYAQPYQKLAKNLAASGYNEKDGDIFIDPIKIMGGTVLQPSPTSKKKHIHPDSTICGSLYSGGRAYFKFDLPNVAKGDYLLQIRASSAIRNKFKVALNGEVIGNEVTLKNSGRWEMCDFVMPAKLLKKGENQVWLRNSGGNGYPVKFEFAIIKNKVPEIKVKGKK
ncbi:MAG: beta-N-acetylglucosaminidase domain-containing protein [Kiritimatiellae bacterium]|nr:beta-N-acetylglucosaminidase domain-containing protein [Kiritimatiellia bacterium]